MTAPTSVVITGASSGIGAALAAAEARPGVRLGLTGRDAARLAEVAARCRAAGATVTEGIFDVRETAVLKAFLTAFDDEGPIDQLYANAGVAAGLGPGRSAEAEETAMRLVDVNLKAVIVTVGAVVERMRARRAGHIVLISSLAGLSAQPDLPTYSATKAAVRFYGDALRQWLRRRDVAVTIVCPGFVTSPMADRHKGSKPFEISAEKAAALILAGVAKRRPLIAFPWPLVVSIWFSNLVPTWLSDLGVRSFAAVIEPDPETRRERGDDPERAMTGDGGRAGRAGLFLPPAWRTAPWLPALVDATEVVVSPSDRDGGGLDRVVTGGDAAARARGFAYARRFDLPIVDWREAPLGPVAPQRLAVAPLAVAPVPRAWREDPAAAPIAPPRCATADLDRGRLAALLALVLGERLMAPRPAAPGGAVGVEMPRRRILVADVPDDGTRPAGLAPAMLAAVRAAHADADIGVVAAPGRRAGLIVAAARAAGLAVIVDDGRPDFLDGVEVVHAAGGLLGLEARLAGRRFVAHGGADPTRAAAIDDPLDLAAALFVAGCRYADPFSGQGLDAEAGLARLSDIRRRFAARRGAVVGFGFSRQKQRTAIRFLGGWDDDVAFAGRRRAVAVAAQAGARLVIWGARGGAALEAEAMAAGVATARLEDGFIRSVGLGTRQTIPASLALDDLGLYYDARRPSRFERMAEEEIFEPALIERARALRRRLIATRVTKYNLAAPPLDFRPAAAGRRVVLVIGQVPDDAAIRFGTVSVGGNLALLAAVRADRPDAYVVYKEHPDLTSRSRAGWLPEATIRAHADRALREGDAIAAIEAADEVHTLTSLAGFEALIRDVPVVTWGIPFYAGWGLTDDREPIPRRRRRLSVDALVALALIRYPAYVDPVSGLPCEVEDIVGRIEAIRAGRIGVPAATRFRSLVRATVVAEAYLRHWLGHRLTPR